MDFQYFVNKACTIITGPINRSFSEKQLQDYFIGIVEAVSKDGIWTRHPITGCKNFYCMSNIIAICEEQIVKDPKIIEKYKEAKKEINTQEAPTSPYIDYEVLAKLSQQSKQLNQKSGVS